MFIEIEDSHIDHFKHKKVVLFGAGSCGQRALEEFLNRGVPVMAFCDNDKKLTGKTIEGYKVIPPERLEHYEDVNVIITSTFTKEIKKQLKTIGIPNVYAAKVGVLKKTIQKSDFRNPILSMEEANRTIYEALTGDDPFFVGRLGSVELECLTHFLYFLNRRGETKKKDEFPPNVKNMMWVNAGFFPPQDALLDRFSDLYLKEMQNLDLVWVMWLSKYEDRLFHDFYKEKTLAIYDELYLPIHMHVPWTWALEGKKVLVVHPFEESIRKNYQVREKSFKEKPLLPNFELITLKSVQSIAGTPVEYKDWFHALDDMKEKMERVDFDVALIGAGAYGLPLASHAKRIGKKSVHVGGALQLYFGIKGKAWNKLNLYNEYWTNPKRSERPENYKKVEAGRYW